MMKYKILALLIITLSVQARFTQVDPLWAEYPSFTPYNYAANNPLKYVDPDGRAIIAFTQKGTSSNPVYDQAVVVFSNDGEYIGTFSGSSTANPFLPDNPDIRGVDAYPQVASGVYPAENGEHLGNPAIIINGNNAVPTTAVNPRFPAQGATAIAIHLHSGSNSNWKGSAGCPTISSEEWKQFIRSIPDEPHMIIIPEIEE